MSSSVPIRRRQSHARISAMLTLDKLRVYQRFDGDLEGWARTTGGRDDSGMRDEDWFLIDALLQGLTLVASGHATQPFATALEQRLLDADTDAVTRQALRALAR